MRRRARSPRRLLLSLARRLAAAQAAPPTPPPTAASRPARPAKRAARLLRDLGHRSHGERGRLDEHERGRSCPSGRTATASGSQPIEQTAAAPLGRRDRRGRQPLREGARAAGLKGIGHGAVGQGPVSRSGSSRHDQREGDEVAFQRPQWSLKDGGKAWTCHTWTVQKGQRECSSCLKEEESAAPSRLSRFAARRAGARGRGAPQGAEIGAADAGR